LIVFAGLHLGGIVIPEEDLDFYIQDALNEIEFLTGDITTEYGAKRADLGYEKPFSLKFVGVSCVCRDALDFFWLIILITRLEMRITSLPGWIHTTPTASACSMMPYRRRILTLSSCLPPWSSIQSLTVLLWTIMTTA
jgi:hypothetical protein